VDWIARNRVLQHAQEPNRLRIQCRSPYEPQSHHKKLLSTQVTHVAAFGAAAATSGTFGFRFVAFMGILKADFSTKSASSDDGRS
jgi:hypothetical protein